MKRKHIKTLTAIFARPVSGNVQWRDIEALFKALGATIEEREGSRVAVILFGQVQVYHRPHPSPNTDKGAVASICRWLETNDTPLNLLRSKQMMNNQMMINGHIAVISFDPDVGLFRGEFVGLNGGADFYADSVDGLHKEGEASLKTFLEVCQEQGLEPYKNFSGKFITRVPASLHERIAAAATAAGMSLNQWVQIALEREATHS